MWQSIQIRCSEQSCNKSPWENDHKSQLVKPILMKLMVLEQRLDRIAQCKFLDHEDEQGTRGSPYKFPMLNSPEISQLGKTLISPNW